MKEVVMKLEPELLNLIGNGSIALIVFVMWYISIKQFSRQQEKNTRQEQENVKQMFVMLEQDIKYKEVLTALLSRMETKIDIALRNER
jgi:uncharacterized protein YneF (UPF0154 family)